MARSLAVAAALLVLSLSGAAAAADEVTLVWNPNSESDLAGYKVYYGTASGVYGAAFTVTGNNPTFTITGLGPGTYYFAVTAYNSAGLESGFSNEVSTALGGVSTSSPCDANKDGSVNVLDLQGLINTILGVPSGTGRDLNGDNRIDVLDLQLLGNVILGVRTCPN